MSQLQDAALVDSGHEVADFFKLRYQPDDQEQVTQGVPIL